MAILPKAIYRFNGSKKISSTIRELVGNHCP
uniref:Uncharacterized protein n=1 Tax=Trichinella nativa TaxID=6335 RepID=A0A0V1KHT6_9BILA